MFRINELLYILTFLLMITIVQEKTSKFSDYTHQNKCTFILIAVYIWSLTPALQSHYASISNIRANKW